MSGIEVVGVVLTIIPLITTALTKYEKTASTFRNSPKEFRDVNRRLNVEVAILKNSLQKLLDDTTLDDQVQLELLEDVEGKRWEDKSVQEELKNRLTNSFQPYLETIRDMKETLIEFKTLLMIGRLGEVPFEDSRSFKDMYKRFSFARKKSDYMGLIDQMHDGNLTLARLTEHIQAPNSAPKRDRRTAKPSQIPDFEKVRERAVAVFHTLQERLNVSCKVPHKVRLNMKPHEDTGTTPKAGASPNECIFRLVVHHGPLQSTQTAPYWLLEEAEIRSLAATMVDSVTSVAPVVRVPEQSGASKHKKSVKWAKPSIPTSPPQVTPTPQLPSGEEIKDLCASIERLRAAQCGVCFGYMVDSSRRRHGIYKPYKFVTESASSTMLSLGTLLSTRKTRKVECLWMADSRRLALALSYGVLRLHNTPWLKSQWSGDDIVLFEQNNKIATDHPFVSAEPGSLEPATGAAAISQPSNPLIRSQTIFALAMVLIELCLREPWQDLHVPEDLNADGTKHVATDYLTAFRLLGRVEGEAGPKYGGVVKRCLELSRDLNYADPSLNNDAFRRAFYEDVVVVLEEHVASTWT